MSNIIVETAEPITPPQDAGKLKDAEAAPPAEAVEEKEADASESSEKEDKEDTDAKEGEEQESEPEAREEAKEKPKKGVEKRFSELTRKRKEAERERDYWREQALAKQAQAPKSEQSETAETKPAATGKPKSEDYESHAEFVEALADWKAEQKWAEKEAKAREAKQKEEQQKAASEFDNRWNKARETIEDFEEVVDACEVPLSFAVKNIISRDPNGPELAYQLAKHPDRLEEICKLDAIDAAIAVGEFKASLKKPTESKQQITKAPKPITPVGSHGTTKAKRSIYDPDISQAEYEELRRQQRAKKGA